MKIAICVPMPVHVPHAFIRSLIEIISYTKQNLPELTELSYLDQTGVRTDRNRNVMIQKALEAGMDYILWLDADMVYPADIVCKYMEHKFDVIGCIYFKRKHPYDPVLYVDGTNPIKPYKMIDPTSLPKDTVVEVDGLGFGGVMVNCDVYKKMGDDKWMKYGDNYHLPYETENQLTHDLVWCKKAKQHGHKIYVHTGVLAGHVKDQEIGIEDFIEARKTEIQKEVKQPSVVVVMPTIHPDIAVKTAKILSSRAGYPHKMLVVEDEGRSGFVATCNEVVKRNPADYYVYLTDDIFPSRNWLKDSMKLAIDKKAGLVGYNDGKWSGAIATCGLVEHNWMLKNYNGDMFYPKYFGHYNDTELTILALSDKTYAYDPSISLIEIDYEKEQKKVHKADRSLFMERKRSLFDGRSTEVLANEYA